MCSVSGRQVVGWSEGEVLWRQEIVVKTGCASSVTLGKWRQERGSSGMALRGRMQSVKVRASMNEKMGETYIEVVTDEAGNKSNARKIGDAKMEKKRVAWPRKESADTEDSQNVEGSVRPGRKSRKQVADKVENVAEATFEVLSVEENSGPAAQRAYLPSDGNARVVEAAKSRSKEEVGSSEGMSVNEGTRMSFEDADEDRGQPLFVDEEDPEWPAEGEQGWGFKVSDFFKDVRVRNETWEGKEGEERHVADEFWEEEPRFVDVTHVEWEAVAIHDGSPLVVAIYSRYGQGQETQRRALQEVEKMANTIWDAGNAYLRAAKLDISMEVDLASALRVKKAPAVLFLKNGKCHCRIDAEDGLLDAQELVKIAAHVFYGAMKPSSLAQLQERRKSVDGAQF